jgi:hypothetical protein
MQTHLCKVFKTLKENSIREFSFFGLITSTDRDLALNNTLCKVISYKNTKGFLVFK